MPEAEVELLQVISQPLVMEIHYEVYCPILAAHPFFKRYHRANLLAVRKLCHTAVRMFSLSHGDLLFVEGEQPTTPRMFFIVKGSLLYLKQGSEYVWQVKVGAWACEMALWVRWSHLGSLRAAKNCNILSLDAATFQIVAHEFHEPMLWPALYAREVARCLNGEPGTQNAAGDLPSERNSQSPPSSSSVGMVTSSCDDEIDDVCYGCLNVAEIVASIFWESENDEGYHKRIFRGIGSPIGHGQRRISQRSGSSHASSQPVVKRVRKISNMSGASATSLFSPTFPGSPGSPWQSQGHPGRPSQTSNRSGPRLSQTSATSGRSRLSSHSNPLSETRIEWSQSNAAFSPH